VRLHVFSDLHFEISERTAPEFFVSQGWHSLERRAEVAILAGDVGSTQPGRIVDTLVEPLLLFSRRYRDVFYVPGNHEPYGTSLRECSAQLVRHVVQNPDLANVHVLRAFPAATPTAAAGRAIHGGSLWFPSTEETEDPMRRRLLNDFHLIQDIDDAPHEHEQLLASLRQRVSPGDLVVTHHGPSLLSVPTEFVGSVVNCFFTTDLEELIRTLKPALWVHGHAHNPLDYWVGETRIYANPLGYPGEGSNPDFWQRVEIEL
jgi:predicted phosphodiesterase